MTTGLLVPLDTAMSDATFPKFMQHVDKSAGGCWNWTGKFHSDKPGQQYGCFYAGPGVTSSAHRLSYRHFVGDPGTLLVCHKCDNPKCVNPDHLFLGTHEDNAHDAIRKGRLFTVREVTPWKRLLTHCKYGHPLSGTNLRLRADGTGRVCKECARRESRERWRRKVAQTKAAEGREK